MSFDFAPHNLTSPTTPPPYVVTASGGSLAIQDAFDGNTGTYCALSGLPCFIKLDAGFSFSTQLISYSILAPGGDTRLPKAWTVQGSNDNISWTTLDTRVGEIGWSGGELRNYICSGVATTFRYFQFVITDNQVSGTYTTISQIYLYVIGGTDYLTFNVLIPDAQINASYSYKLNVLGGTPGYVYAITSGSLPTGLSMNSSGLITGTPTVGGMFAFTLQITDSISTVISASTSIFVYKPGLPSISSTLMRLESVLVTSYENDGHAAFLDLFLGNATFDPTLQFLGGGTPTSGLGNIFVYQGLPFGKTVFYNAFDLNAISPDSSIKLSPSLDVSNCILFLTIDDSAIYTSINVWNIFGFYFRATYSDGSRLYSSPTNTAIYSVDRIGDVIYPELAVDPSFNTFTSVQRARFSVLSTSITFKILNFGSFGLIQPDKPIFYCPPANIGNVYY